jgi:lipoyl(octanoyl) transferase
VSDRIHATRTTRQWRLVDDLGTRLAGVQQMAADVALLDDVAHGAGPVLRLYRWARPALSLGRFQPDGDVDKHACDRLNVEVVRRPTGGRALLHGGDLTYAVAIPRPSGAAGDVDAVYSWLAGGLIAALGRLGVQAEIGRHRGPSGPACFATAQGADLRVGERKLCGSAQVHRAGGVLQHGSILLEHLRFDETDVLVFASPGERDVARRWLGRAPVTLDELGVASEPETVAAAIVAGFEDHLDLTFGSRLDLPFR